jgi:UTP--glucose-1-phosphate uridylyltransferase
MTKSQAIELFGSTSALWKALGITRQGLHQWPEELAQDQIDRVTGAAIRTGRMKVPEGESAQG